MSAETVPVQRFSVRKRKYLLPALESVKINKKILALAAISSTAILWGWSFVYAKALLEHIDPVFLTGTTFLLSGLVFLGYCLLSGRTLRFRWREGLLLGVLLAWVEVAQTIGLSQTTAANTVFISGLGVLMVPFFEKIIFKKKVPVVIWLALGVSLLGLYLLTGGVHEIGQGDLWVFFCALGVAGYLMASDRFEKERQSDIYALCAQQFLAVGIFASLLSIFLGTFEVATLKPFLREFFILTIFATLLPYYFIQFSEEYLTSFQITFVSSLEPFVGGLLAWTYGREPYTALMVAGGLAMACASLIAETTPSVQKYVTRDRLVFIRRFLLVALMVVVSIGYALFLLSSPRSLPTLFSHL